MSTPKEWNEGGEADYAAVRKQAIGGVWQVIAHVSDAIIKEVNDSGIVSDLPIAELAQLVEAAIELPDPDAD